VHILFTEDTENTVFYESVPEGMLKNTNGVSDESEADLYSQGKSFSNSMC
jgi:hypothetical protein